MVIVMDLPTFASAPASIPSTGSPLMSSAFRMLSHSSGEQGLLLAFNSPMRSCLTKNGNRVSQCGSGAQEINKLMKVKLLTLNHIWLLAFGGNKLDIQGL